MPKINKCVKKVKHELHCPVSGCLFAEGSERHFSEKKFLNQHIAKVHAEKKYSCSKCQKSFGLDWWRKHHEKSCGTIWKCDCGAKYPARESLLTHIRRTNHKLPDCVALKNKMKQNKITPKSFDNPVIVLIQPIIQNITCMQQPLISSTITQRRILPKTSQPYLTLPLPISTSTPVPMLNNTSPVILEQTNENHLFKSVQPVAPETPALLHSIEDISIDSSSVTTNIQKSTDIQKTASTQTIDNAFASINCRQSQASQCSRRKPKSLKVGIESHTQTAESAVTKIKKRKSRRKSVAITTEKSMLTDQILGPDNVFWPGFKDFVLQHAESLGARLFKSSTSTQTNSMICNKTLCDSETLTDSELLKLPWGESVKLNKTKNSDGQFQMITDVDADNIMSVNIDSQNIQELNVFTNSRLNNFNEIQVPKNTSERFPDDLNTLTSMISGTQEHSKANSRIGINSDHGSGMQIISDTSSICGTITNNSSNQNCSMFSVFDNCSNKISAAPTLSNTHTQTIASEVLDYNLLTNMETQTTDDFNFSYLEFSDTETQTPWEDFPNVDDSILKTDQLSIEIQTDFSSFDPGLNLDPYELINSIDVQNMVAGSSGKETAAVNTETQTLDRFYFPQFTNSESQTLDIPDFMFDP